MKNNRGQPDGKEYRVGKGRPPRSTQWKPGQSGNPNGRPKGSKNLTTIYSGFLNKKCEIREQGKIREITVREALVWKLFQKGMAGDRKTIEYILAMEPEIARALRSHKMITSDMTPQEAAEIYARSLKEGFDD
jgi:hypothetical protein